MLPIVTVDVRRMYPPGFTSIGVVFVNTCDTMCVVALVHVVELPTVTPIVPDTDVCMTGIPAVKLNSTVLLKVEEPECSKLVCFVMVFL